LIAELPIMRDLPAGVRERSTGDKEVMAELFGGFAVALATGVGWSTWCWCCCSAASGSP
jgi:HAE1 family hydrophobic/amphiphilic exporter-1